MKLIADSGSTKTAWCLVDGDGRETEIYTQGINPFQQDEEGIVAVLRDELQTGLADDVLLHVPASGLEVYFYGAGCTPEGAPRVAAALLRVLGPEARIEVHSDMLGAARALCGHNSGLVAILGTGANSCAYDGTAITANVSPLGFILGDEGSGAYIGKRLVGDVLKHQLPDDVCRLFLEETGETPSDIIRKTYRQPLPNRFLASLSPFCLRHRGHPAIHSLLLDCFSQFFIRNIRAYASAAATVHFVGSIAFHYRPELTEAATALGYTVGRVLQTPLRGLIDYHS